MRLETGGDKKGRILLLKRERDGNGKRSHRDSCIIVTNFFLYVHLFFFLYQHDILISLKLREKFISPPPGTSETPSGKNRQKSRATYYEQACCSLKISGSLTFHHQRTGSFVRKRGILISFHLRSSFIPSDF